MGCPLRVRVPIFLILLVCAAGCGGNPESAAAAGTAGSADAPIGITISNTYVTLENRTGAPLLDGEIVITQLGVRPPFRAAVPRLDNGTARDFTLSTFRAPDGTNFTRSLARPKSVRVTAKDASGKTFEQEIPFQ
jgi:hypothetical protein